jgi:uncharacterized membrane protein YfcA
MSVLHILIIFLAGLAAGAINAAVGSGSLITFPTLIALGYAPVLANVSNNIGLVPGNLSGVYGYRRELSGQGRRLQSLGCASLAGGVTGALLLLVLPSHVFAAVVPVLIGIALVLVLAGPRLSALVARRRGGEQPRIGPLLMVCVYGTGVYGGYFGAAQSIILIALLSIFLVDSLQRLNAAKNVLAMLVNLVASIVFVIGSEVDWKVVGIIAVGSAIGGQMGANVGRRLDPRVLRGVIVAVGLVAVVKLVA